MNLEQRNEIQMYIDDCVKQGVFPGANMVVYHQGEANFFSCGNKALFPQVEENNMDTIYDLASLSKVVVTVPLIMKLIETGNIHLNTRICDVLKERIPDEITIQDLLTHCSGLPADTKIDLTDKKEIIWDKIYHCEQIVERGKKVLYSDVGFLLLGKVIETCYQMPLDQVAQKEIFIPLQMKDTCYCPSAKLMLRCAPTEDSHHFNQMLRGIVHDRKAHLLGGVAGHAGVFSTIQDMSHILEMHLHRGLYQSRLFLSSESIEAFSTVLTPANEVKRGIGFLIKDEGGIFPSGCSDMTYGHTGFAGTSMLVDPNANLGIVILSNRIHPSRENNKILSKRKEIHEKIYQVLKIKF